MLLSMGEILIDLIPGKNFIKNPNYLLRIGGAPANVAIIAAELGLKTFLYAKIGKDFFGEKILEFINKSKINNEFIRTSNNNTTLAVVSLDKEGERSFSFYREETADYFLQENDIKIEDLEKIKLFHFGSLGLIRNPSKNMHKLVLDYARSMKKWISFDPNYRESLWENKFEAVKTINEFLIYPNILKLSIEELFFLTDEININLAIEKIFKFQNIKLVFVTQGEKGSIYFDRNRRIEHDGYKTNVIDTTGAGDAYMSMVLYLLTSYDNLNLSNNQVKCILKNANKIGSITTEDKGAILSINYKDLVNLNLT